VGHHGQGSGGGAIGRFKFDKPEQFRLAIQRLNRFRRDCSKKGVKVFFSFPPYAARAFNRDQSVIMRFEAELRRQLEIPLIDTPADTCFPDQDFFDTSYHLSEAGKKKHSLFLAERLERALVN